MKLSKHQPSRRLPQILLFSLFAWIAISHAADDETEIELLLSAVGSSGCQFIRNGKEHSAPDAEDHLRMKYKKGARYAPTAEYFITRIASKSSWTGKPYQIACPDEAPQPSGQWLTNKLQDIRNAHKP
jgi:hypothetical protein